MLGWIAFALVGKPHVGLAEWIGDNVEEYELYDLNEDPWEQNNVAKDPGYEEQAKRMAKLLKDGWKAALPPQN